MGEEAAAKRRRVELDNSPLLEQIGVNLPALRRAKGLTLDEVAARSQIGVELLRELEEGQDYVPSSSHVIRLAQVLQVRPSALVAGVSWAPYEVIVGKPGRFLVEEDADLVAEIAALQERRGRGRPRADA